jgi:orotate phosphoribosyltransferase
MPSLDQDDVLGLFRRTGALLKGHFRLSSGLHSNGYLQSALVLSDPVLAGQLGAALAVLARDLGAELVLSPALGGLVIGHEVARALGVRAIFAERQDGRMTLRRGFSIAPGTRVLVVEDVVTTGVSTRETMAVVEASGGRVVGAASIIDRSGGRAELGGPYVALARIDLPTWDQTACPLCASGVPVVKPGSRPTPSAAS